jgi:hypothetical protein
MESEYIKERRLAWFAFKDLHKGEKGLSVQSFCAGYDAAQHRVQRTAGTWRKFLNFVGRVAGSLRRR